MRASRANLEAAEPSPEAEALLLAAPPPQQPGWAWPLRGSDGGGAAVDEAQPLVDAVHWERLPKWIALHAERGQLRPRCFFGDELKPANALRWNHGCYKCGERPLKFRAPMLRCHHCGWGVCGLCAALPRLPSLPDDPLFLAPSVAALLGAPGAPALVPPASFGAASSGDAGRCRGTVIVCPGGNYEFLCPSEGLPVAEWLVQKGINACVLKYRLLPRHGHEDAIDDLRIAARRAREAFGGPVAAIGFSAGGHLIASLAAREQQEAQLAAGVVRHALDAQVLVYPGLDGRDWLEESTCGFFNNESLKLSPTLIARQQALLGGEGFAAPATLLVASTGDVMTPPEQHCEPYVQALRRGAIPHRYLLGDFGSHGFALEGGWTDSCVDWLRSRGFGSGACGEETPSQPPGETSG